MTVGIFWHPDIFLHDRHAKHCAMDSRRIETVAAAVLTLAGTKQELAGPVSPEQLFRVHDPDYLAMLASSAHLEDHESMTVAPQSALNKHSWRAMELSAGAACQAVDAVLAKRVKHAFNPVYAGHHAEFAGAGGFCFINTALVAAMHAQARGAKRIAVLDFDTHSGNGTIMGLLAHPEMLFAETYQQGYPGPFLKHTTRPGHILREQCRRREDFIKAWSQFFTTLSAWQPDIMIVSAGFDAHKNDPLSEVNLDDADYEWLAKGLRSIGAPVVASLEGGYSVPDVARCAALFVATLARA